MSKLSKYYARLAELISRRIDLSEQISNYPVFDKQKAFYEEQLKDNRKLIYDLGEIEYQGHTVIDLTAEKKQLERTILHCYANMEQYKQSLIQGLKETEAEIDEVESLIDNHWTNKMRRSLCYMGLNVSIARGGY